MKIPKKFKLFATTYNIGWDNEGLNKDQSYGTCDYSKSEIKLSTTNGLQGLSKDKIMDTYYHEKVHAILDMMHEYELSKNEKFVDTFGKLLRQSDETQEF